MNIICDVDGVLFNFGKPFRAWANTVKGYNLKKDPEAWNWGLPDEEFFPLLKEYEPLHDFKTQPYCEKTIVEDFNELASLHTVFIVSNIKEEYREFRDKQLEKFNYLGFPYYSYPDKAEFLMKNFQYQLDVVIDDKPSFLNKIASRCKLALYPEGYKYIKGLIGNNIKPYPCFKEIKNILKDYE